MLPGRNLMLFIFQRSCLSVPLSHLLNLSEAHSATFLSPPNLISTNITVTWINFMGRGMSILNVIKMSKAYNFHRYGQGLGRVQGVGYINELLARLAETPVRDNTQTNRTLDASPETFPLNRTIYADFSHDNQMIAIYAAMGLFRQVEALDPCHPDQKRTWVTSQLTPFSGRMVVERLTCTGAYRARPADSGTFVRILVNDALQPLQFCEASPDGLCTLDAFVESQSFARNDGEGDFEKCFD